ncbi:hypothetical protein L1987_12120 [Smallanthus sonchifolius]|uniref:Uncharacterized protein n=1 Tax=Smallanthus sonchifolius TaxID=185202 RepID=A0ACB9JDS0_9ASTR|nr:hypothetical protein L1987_12120 [Smallanthus sonchifolius]
MGNNKLHINIARFSNENANIPIDSREFKRQPIEPKESRTRVDMNIPTSFGRKSFKDALVKDYAQQIDDRCIVIPSTVDAFSEIHGKALVGRVKDFTTLRTLNCLLRDVGCSGLDIQCIGDAGKVIVTKETGKTPTGEEEQPQQPAEGSSQKQGADNVSSEVAGYGGFDLNANPVSTSIVSETQEKEIREEVNITEHSSDERVSNCMEMEQDIQDTIEVGNLLGVDLLNHLNEVRKVIIDEESTDPEDTAFYAQLTRQILLLVDEDDETHANGGINGAPEFGRRSYFGWLEGGRSLEVPGWMERLWANNGGGTGVFIPRDVAAGKPRRKRHHKSRKNKNGGGKHSSA